MVGRILNLDSRAVSPQFHVVYDDLFTTVPVDDSLDGSSFLNHFSVNATLMVLFSSLMPDFELEERS